MASVTGLNMKFIALVSFTTLLNICCVIGEVENGFAPVFTVKPQNTSVRIGYRIVLRCKVKSNPRAAITWLKDGKPVKFPFMSRSMRKRSILVKYNADLSDAGKFSCIARNVHGSVSTDAFVTIVTYSAPVFKQKPTNVTLFFGMVYTMPCEATGVPDPTYTWTFNGAPLQESPVILMLPRGGLFFADVRISDSGRYTCSVDNRHGFKSADAYLKVVKEPTVVKSPQDLVKVSDGLTAVFNCSVAADQISLRFIWKKDGVRIRRKPKYEMTGPFKEGTLLKFSLKIKNINLSDSGSYQCKAVKDGKSSTSNPATLTVVRQARPQVSLSQTVVKAEHGSTIRIRCMATGLPYPKVSWFKGNLNVLLRPDPRINVTDTSANDDIVELDLHISDVWYTDEGVYSCSAKNALGFDNRRVSLIVYGKPEEPTNIQVNQTAENEIVVSWDPGRHDGEQLDEYIVGYRQNGSYIWRFISVAGNQTRASLNIRIGEKLFFFIVKAKNKYGISSAREEVSFRGQLKLHRKEMNPGHRDESDPPGSSAIIGGLLGAVAAVVLLIVALISVRKAKQRKLNEDRYPSAVLYTTETTTSGDGHDEHRQGNNYAYVQVKKGHYATPSVPDTKLRTNLSNSSFSEIPNNEYDNILCQPVQYEVPKRNVILEKEIGSGNFGCVFKGYLKVKSGKKVVAVKMLKGGAAGEQERKTFIDELEFMKSLSPHPNIVGLVGCCTKSKDPFILVEYCSLGDLQTFLCSSRAEEGVVYSNLAEGSFTLRSKDLLSFGWQVARGMTYLASVKCVHRDLAARNVLVAEGNTCKIADFGLARDIYRNNQYVKTTEGELPLRWMAYESIFHGITTTESDVWSFGILLWEIVTLGASPYPQMTKEQVISTLHLGKRMLKPPYCSDELYAVMWQCWQQEPGDRPSFLEISRTLERLMAAETLSIDLINFDPLYANSSMELMVDD